MLKPCEALARCVDPMDLADCNQLFQRATVVRHVLAEKKYNGTRHEYETR